MSARQELHDLILSCGLSNKTLIQVTGLSNSALYKHKNNREILWVSEPRAEEALNRLQDYLTNPVPIETKTQVKTNVSGEVLGFELNEVDKFIAGMLQKHNEILKQVQYHRDEADRLEFDAVHIEDAVNTVRRIYKKEG